MNAKRRQIPHLFAEWGRVSRRMQSKRRVVVFLDFDGTLVRIAPTPPQVSVDPGTRAALRKLAQSEKLALVVISGRRRTELQRHVCIAGIRYLGLYGWDTNGNVSLPLKEREALVSTMLDLRARLPEKSGVWIEPKGASFSVHLMGVKPEARQQAEQVVKRIIGPHRRSLKVIANLRDLEVAPVLIGDKGTAVQRILNEPAMRGALPMYFGDDFSDESGFAAVKKGISVLVGRRRATRAKFCLRGPAEVTETLSRMEEILDGPGSHAV